MQIIEAFQLATTLHAGQVDKAGRPYSEHLVRVYLRSLDYGADTIQQIAALLHDSIEDGKATKQELLDFGVPPESVYLISVLSKPEGISYMDYILSVKAVPRTIPVKNADLDDNSDPKRLANLPAEVAERLSKKYAKAKSLLNDVSSSD
jgi:hypothetical protein